MYLHEMEQEELGAYYDPNADNTKLDYEDSRKTRLTLRHINKLRTMNDLRAVEVNQKKEKIRKQYGAAPEAAGGISSL